jgi:hypothetical protein
MAITLNHIVSNSKSFNVEFEGGNLNVTYNPRKLSAAYLAKVNEYLEEGDTLAMGRLFCEIISDWDLVGPFNEEGDDEFVAAGVAVPLEPEYVAWIPGPTLQHVLSEAAADSVPKSTKRQK